MGRQVTVSRNARKAWLNSVGASMLLRCPAPGSTTSRVAQHQRADPLGRVKPEMLSDLAAHRQPDDMGLGGAEMVHHAEHVFNPIVHVQRSVVVIALAPSAAVDGGGHIVIRQRIDLLAPVGPIPADAVKEHDEVAGSLMVHGEGGCRVYARGLHLLYWRNWQVRPKSLAPSTPFSRGNAPPNAQTHSQPVADKA